MSMSPETAAALESGRDENGRFGAHHWRLRVIAQAQLARRTPPSAIGPNITDAVGLVFPGVNIATPSISMLRKWRGELTITSEALAAFQIAGCKRVVSFGSDESTKKQVNSARARAAHIH